MSSFLPTIIYRHRKENLRKCTLSGLESREDMRFFSYPEESLPEMDSYVLLKVGAKTLSEEDANSGIFLIDGTWKYAEAIEKQSPKMIARSLPSGFKTAYPRKQTLCPEPEYGLASVEALYLAYLISGRETKGLLDCYYWKDEFLRINDL